MKNTHLYFILNNKMLEDKNCITKLDFVKSIHKIGQSADTISRDSSYVHLDEVMSRFFILTDTNARDVLFGENITTQNINLLNLKGSKKNGTQIYISQQILTFIDQNILSSYFFNLVYEQAIDFFSENTIGK